MTLSPPHKGNADEVYAPLVLYTIDEAAGELGVTVEKLRGLMRRRKIAFIAGRPNLFEQIDLDEYRARVEQIAKSKRPPEPGSSEAEAAAQLKNAHWLRKIEFKMYLRERNRQLKAAADKGAK
jgi:hypothetical protein